MGRVGREEGREEKKGVGSRGEGKGVGSWWKRGRTYRKNQLGPQPGASLLCPLILGNSVQNRLHVSSFGQARSRHSPGCGTQLKIDDAVVGEVAKDREGSIA